ncbi:MAG: SulP family inorganic anion transporter [Alphaproteobacteria bacterium]|nr:MAG: SulP family inorganic anion transporter [Alphaproteobacteria bacterium]
MNLQQIRGDLFGGVTAAIVALPLALAFGVASGLGPAAGLWGAIALGFFAALFGGTPSQVSGPTGPMTVVMAGAVASFGSEPGLVFTAVMLAGLFQIAFGALRVGRFVALMPYPVISGFMSGIGVIIIVLQLEPLLGHAAASGGVLGALKDLPAALAAPDTDALALAGIALAIVFFWPKRLGHFLPSPLAALIVGTLAAVFWLDHAPVLGAIPSGLPALQIPLVDLAHLSAVTQTALVLAALGAIDTLLTSLVADNLTKTEHHPDRELRGQGIGNFIAGLLGGIPGAGATMRTVVNIRAGGRTRLSGMIHALLLLAMALGLGPLAAHIPHAVLAGILIKVGVDIIDWEGLRQVVRNPGEGVLFMLIVFVLTVFVDLITAVGVGMFLAAILFVQRMSDFQLDNIHRMVAGEDGTLEPDETALLEKSERRIVVYRLSGPFSFGAAKGMVRKMTNSDDYDDLILDFTAVPFLDTSAARAVREVVERATSAGKRVFLAGLGEKTARMLRSMGALTPLPSTRLCTTRRDAIRAATEPA